MPTVGLYSTSQLLDTEGHLLKATPVVVTRIGTMTGATLYTDETGGTVLSTVGATNSDPDGNLDIFPDVAGGRWFDLWVGPTKVGHAFAGEIGVEAGSIPESQVTGLVADLAATEKLANKGAPSGYAPLDAGGLVPAAMIPELPAAGATGIAPLSGARFVGANKVGALVYTGTGGASPDTWDTSAHISVNPGDQMTLSGYIDASTCSGAGTVAFNLDNLTESTAYASITQANGQAGWLTTTFTVPAGVTQVVLLPEINGKTVASGGKVVWACPRLELGPYANPFNAPGNLITDPGFLGGSGPGTSWVQGATGSPALIPAVAPGTVPGQFTPPSGPPASGTWQKDDVAPDGTGKLYVCTRGGTVGANLLSAQDSEFEGAGVGGWGGQNATLSNSTAQAHSGTHSLSMAASVAGGCSATSPVVAVTPGQTFRATSYVRAASATANVFTHIGFLDAAGNFTGGPQGPILTDSTTAWTPLTVSGIVPDNATQMFVYVSTTTGSIGDVHYIDTVSLVPDVTWARPGVEDRLLVPGGETSIERRLATADNSAGTGAFRMAVFTAARSETVSQLTMVTASTAASGATLCRMALGWVDDADNFYLLGATANDTSLFTATNAAYTRSMTGPVAKVAGQRYAVGAIVVGTSGPSYKSSPFEALARQSIKPTMTGVLFGSDVPSSGAIGSLGWSPYAEVTP